MTAAPPPTLVDADWLAARLDDPSVVPVDATFHLPIWNRDAAAEFLDGHIPGAVFFDIDRISLADDPRPHMMPTPAGFAAAVGALGIGPDAHVVLYDSHGLMSAARGWFMFKAFGHAAVSLLDGGLPAWTAADRPMETGPSTRFATPYPVPDAPALPVVDMAEILADLPTRALQVIDARAPERYAGSVPEPREGLAAGHIPGAANVPFAALLDPQTGRLLPPEDLKEAFDRAGVDLDRPIVTSCGSGVTACVVSLALDRIGVPSRVYDGSWSEWGATPDAPVATGPDRG